MLNLAPIRLLNTTSIRKMSTTPKDITIIGGGIIGCCTAYFLTRHPSYSPETHRITLLEASSSNSGGRTADSIQDPATLADPATASKKNPAHEGIAGGASGKAGGLLALWAFPQNIVPLSFKLHDELAKEHGGDKRWGYRRCYASQIDCRARLPPGFSGDATGGKDPVSSGAEQGSKGLHKDHKKDAKALRKLGAPEDLDWLDTDEALAAYEGMGTPKDTAQVHPELFARSMAQLAEDKGVKIVTGARVTNINKTANGASVESVTYIKDGKEETLPTTDCVVAAGPWTRRLLPNIRVNATRAHSVVIKTPKSVSAYALFTSIMLPPGFPTPTFKDSKGTPSAHRPLRGQQIVEPEIYARPDGTAYACGPTDDTVELPLTTAEVEVDVARCEDIIHQIGGISDELGKDGEVLAKQACYLPQGGPWIGEVGSTKGLVVAAGHTCWGIQNAPATGKLVSEIILDGRPKSARLGGCDPSLSL
ncbi:FAD dependent oxidoreductase [Hypoxylon trugodes]|uniref:FAD dependent oxidoreductase n=1 Tax=Hypoxylon trugodes TaxID=326681 RepID=UPI002197C9D2|nr:FAD dependent oxidoreductase [Hypoxylon trugodes]KAI1387785.1 FAD dependent oxidoreductase [Hypoxylon trugodes]